MSNLSKQKRDDLVNKLTQIEKFISDAKQDENTINLLKFINEVKYEINDKVYGLIFEEHEENVDSIYKKTAPIVIENKEMFIDNGDKINFLIEGDNLYSLNILNKTHSKRIDLIYIDPPYNTGNKDFIYDDSFVDKVDTFKHSKWLSFMKKRLELAKKLLSKRGIILISIDDNEQAVLKLLCDSVFGDQNFISMFVRKTKSMTGDDGNGLNIQHEYLLAYAKDKNIATFVGEQKTFSNYSNPDNDPNGIWTSGDPSAKSGGPSTYFPIENPITGQIDYPPKGRYWAFSQDTMKKYIETGRIKFKTEKKKNQRGFIFKRYAEKMENTTEPVDSLCFVDNAFMNSVATAETNELIGAGKFSYPKPMDFIKRIIKYTTTKNSVVLDFFAGSGTTGHAVMDLNKEDGGKRTFIICTNNDNNICSEVTYPRIKNAISKNGYMESVKYLKVGFVDVSDKLYYEYADEFLANVKELVELENGVNFDTNNDFKIILTDDEADLIIDDKLSCKAIYLGHNVLLSDSQTSILKNKNIKINVIPDYYYKELEA